MKKIRLFTMGITLSASFLSMATASVCHFVPGLVTCGQGIYNGSIHANSPMTTNGTTITGTTHVNGPLTANNQSNFENTFTVNGPIQINGSTIQGPSFINGPFISSDTTIQDTFSINGPINARSSHFNSSISAATNTLRFTSSSVPNITINSNDLVSSACIMSGSKVNVITFIHNNGIVYLDSSSTVGKISGGKVISSSTCPVS